MQDYVWPCLVAPTSGMAEFCALFLEPRNLVPEHCACLASLRKIIEWLLGARRPPPSVTATWWANAVANSTVAWLSDSLGRAVRRAAVEHLESWR
eukprot:9466472-Pyramimonas_sp.AAC.1